jgi:hypothetical protein
MFDKFSPTTEPAPHTSKRFSHGDFFKSAESPGGRALPNASLCGRSEGNIRVGRQGISSMEQELHDNVMGQEDATVDPAELDAASLPFVGRWNQLVSNTNWEKGRIIYQWRDALIASDAPATEYSDEAWSRRVGGVTGQHVGRLRRVYQRFGETHAEFAGLYWSHFQAALDWDDAEMWLEGAVQSSWSVSQMRHQRWDAMGAVAEEQPRDDEIVTNELDEDFEPATNEPPATREMSTTADVQLGPSEEGADFGDADDERLPDTSRNDGASVYAEDLGASTVEFVRPFADLQELPEDLAEAFEAFKLAILHHKMNHWEAISREDVLSSLEALKQLALAPSDESSA